MKFTPKFCVWELTSLCNLRCIHCGSKAGVINKEQLSLDKCLSVADELIEIGCKNVCLIGGEVTLFPNWDLVANKLIDNGVKTNIITNGYAISKEMITQIKKSKITTVCISIDGMEKNHNDIRGKADCFEQLHKFIRDMNRTNKCLTAVTTLTKNNIDDMEQVYGFLSANNIKIWQMQICSPFGNAKDNKKIIPTKSDIIKIVQLCKRLPKHGMTVQLADNIGYYINDVNGEKLREFKGCSAGVNMIGIDSIGNVRGCESLLHDQFVEGNLKTQSLKQIWNDENNFAYNRKFTVDKLTGNCAHCEHGKFCAGGCRSHNFFSHNKVYESAVCAKGMP